MDDLEVKADRLYGEKKYPEALDIYLSLQKKYPKAEKYSMFCGHCFDAIGDVDEAVKYYKKASKLNPVSTASLLAIANLYYKNEDYLHAEKFASMIIKKMPLNFSALILFGNIAYCQQNYPKAFAFYEKVYRLDKSSYIAVINLANTCYDLERYVKAIDYAKKALQLNPSSIDAYIILGNSYIELGKYEKAEENLLKALNFKSDNPWIYNALSRLYQKTEDYENALNFGWKSVLFAGDALEDQNVNFGYMLYECAAEGKGELAKNYALKWQKAFEKNRVVQYMSASVLEDKKIKQANPEYLEKIFDIFAGDFDLTLGGLEYMVPDLIGEDIQKHFQKELWQKINYLDLGCGTGLCGQKVKDILGWSNAVGVDISQKMLEQAKIKDVYNELIRSEIVDFLKNQNAIQGEKYHIVTASDVLTYFGDLRILFEEVAKSLKLQGVFVFSISENSKTKDDYLLMPSGRFVHQLDYVSKLLKKVGCEVVSSNRHPLRNEGDEVVYGYIITAKKTMIVTK